MRVTNFLVAALAGLATLSVTAEPAAKPVPSATTAPAIATPLAIEPAAIDAALKRLVDNQTIVGASGLVFQGDREVYFGAFGLADRENNKAMARDTVV